MSDFFNSVVKDLKNPYINFASEGGSAEFTGWLDTGSYLLNAAFSGTIFGGVPNNKVTTFAGETTTGKCLRGTEIIEVYVTDEIKDKYNL